MLCESFEKLTPIEKSNFIGKLCHIFQSDESYYQQGLKLIRQSEKRGLFLGVTINPLNPPPDAPEIKNENNPEK